MLHTGKYHYVNYYRCNYFSGSLPFWICALLYINQTINNNSKFLKLNIIIKNIVFEIKKKKSEHPII